MKEFIFVVFSILSLSLRAFGETKSITIKNCAVEFETTGSPTLIRISGKSHVQCTGTLIVNSGDFQSGSFELALDQLDTGIALRNKHLRENYLHIDKFPTAKFILKNVENFKESFMGKKSGKSKFEGTLEMHGKLVSIGDGTYEVQGQTAKAQFSLDLPEYGVDRPSFMGIKVVDKVYTTIKFEF